MRQFKFILIFVSFIVFTTHASVARPFNFKKWNFKRDIDLAYVLMYDVDDGILVKSQGKAASMKMQEVKARLNKLNAYCDNLQKILKNRLKGRFQKEVELPLLKILRKYKNLTRNYKNKKFIENPEYTKLIVERNIKKALFLENYFQSRFKNVKSSAKIKRRIDDNQKSLKSSRGKANNKPLRSNSSNFETLKSSNGLKKCDKKRILNKYNLNQVGDEFLEGLESDDLNGDLLGSDDLNGDLESDDLNGDLLGSDDLNGDLESDDLEGDLESDDLEGDLLGSDDLDY
ncbi:calcium-binding protein [Borreliella lusitaniae]|uniref:calcium-binding protein n=1 Tax=Borreliella lusitaniae TaxID=100177 RepID=UPI003C7967A0